MKRIFIFLSTALATGALTGFLVNDFPRVSGRLPAPGGSLLAAVLPAQVWAAKLKPTDLAVAAVRTFSPAREGSRDGASVPKLGLVLKEPVIVLHGEQPGLNLPTGTMVSLVKAEGRFLQVRHDRNLLTIPRSAVTSRLAQTN